LCAKEIITIQTGNTHTSIENRKKRRSFCEATTVEKTAEMKSEAWGNSFFAAGRRPLMAEGSEWNQSSTATKRTKENAKQTRAE